MGEAPILQPVVISGFPKCSTVTSQLHWQIAAQDIALGYVTLCDENCPVLFDSASAFNVVPQSAVKKIHQVFNILNPGL